LQTSTEKIICKLHLDYSTCRKFRLVLRKLLDVFLVLGKVVLQEAQVE
jgi:hypothetical protein